jgi:hypothetical protein
VTVFKLGEWESGAIPERAFRYWRSQTTDRIAAFVRPSGERFAWVVRSWDYQLVAEGEAGTHDAARQAADAALAYADLA